MRLREYLVRELARSNEDLSQFARIASHDLKAPNGTIALFSELVLTQYRGEVLDERAEEYLNLVISSAGRMTTLISDLLRYAEISSSPLMPARPCEIREVVETVMANLRNELEKSGAQIIYGALPQIKMEGTLLGQLFQKSYRERHKIPEQGAPLYSHIR